MECEVGKIVVALIQFIIIALKEGASFRESSCLIKNIKLLNENSARGCRIDCFSF